MEILYKIWTVISIISVIFTVKIFWNLVINIRKELDLVKDVEVIKKTMKIVYVEQIGTMWHMYDKFTHQFVCQAPTEKELWDLAKKQLPNMKILTADIEVTKQ